MPEAGPHNTEYTQHHPNAITDRDKAEVMARASKSAEEGVVEQTKRAEAALDRFAEARSATRPPEVDREGLYLDAVTNEFRPVDDLRQRMKGTKEEAIESAEKASFARTQADSYANEAAILYDEVKAKLPTTKDHHEG